MRVEYDKYWSNLFDLLIHPVFLLDLDFHVVNCNQPFINLLKKDKTDIIGKKCFELIHSTSGPFEGCPYLQILKTKSSASKIVFEPNLKRWLSVGVSPVFEADKLIGGLHVVLDITEEKAESERVILEEKDKLSQRVNELNRINAVMIGRETKIIEIKREVNGLLAESGRPPKYQV